MAEGRRPRVASSPVKALKRVSVLWLRKLISTAKFNLLACASRQAKLSADLLGNVGEQSFETNNHV
jgi:hypothetical protein